MRELHKFNTAILFLVFNRPIHTKRVFEKISLAKPSRLYIAGDGPREGFKDDKKNAMEFKKKIENKLVKNFAFIELSVSYDNKKNFFRILSFVENEDIADQICEFSKNEKIGCLATKKWKSAEFVYQLDTF